MGKNRSQEVCKNVLIEKVSCEMRFEGGDGILYVFSKKILGLRESTRGRAELARGVRHELNE